jgi:hypothetical protein
MTATAITSLGEVTDLDAFVAASQRLPARPEVVVANETVGLRPGCLAARPD